MTHLAEQKYTTSLLYSRDRPGCQPSVLPVVFKRSQDRRETADLGAVECLSFRQFLDTKMSPRGLFLLKSAKFFARY
jgi:hypothetical protein